MQEKETRDLDECVREMRGDFIASCQDQLRRLEKNINVLADAKAKKSDAEEAMKDIRRVTHNFKGTAQIFGFSATSIISHRFEDYLSNISLPTAAQADDLRMFLDQIEDSVALGETAPVAEIVRQLPVFQPLETPEQKGQATIDQMRARNKDQTLEAILIMPGEKLRRKIIGYELAACGFRITHATASTEAIEMTLRIKPDLILSNQVIDDLISGVELAQFFDILESTKKTPFILLTSFSRQSKELKNLPADVKIARKNEFFVDDLARGLLDFNFLPKWMTM